MGVVVCFVLNKDKKVLTPAINKALGVPVSKTVFTSSFYHTNHYQGITQTQWHFLRLMNMSNASSNPFYHGYAAEQLISFCS